MVLKHLIAYRLAAYVAAFVTVGCPNTWLAKHCICRDIGHSLCILDPHPDDPYADEFCMKLFQEYINKLLHDIREAPPSHLTILETRYSMLYDIGGEEKGYGLYSYAILNNNNRSYTFLKDVFEAILGTDKKDTAAQRSQTNIFQ